MVRAVHPDELQSSSRPRSRLIVPALICGHLLILLAGSEFVVRWQQSRIQKSDRLDPGLVHHDPELGWKLTPNWTGSHRTFDFTVRYTINEAGLRADSPLPSDRRGRLFAVVGDSFTFGLGVNDDETFVHLLNRRFRSEVTFVNFSVPGYSTDQETLLIERDVLKWSPDVLLLGVYVANDLFDNLLEYPLQVNHAKPRFELCAGQLVLTNVPVQVQPKPVEMHRLDLRTMVFGPEINTTWRARIERRSALFNLLAARFWPLEVNTTELRNRFASAIELFSVILDRIQRACDRQGVQLVILLLAGRSFYEEPTSDSGLYQGFLLDEVEKLAANRRIRIIYAIGSPTARPTKKGLFYPHDGHLTPEGHRKVAETVARAIGNLHIESE
ncbi:MAG: hypothetical protein GX456_08090 [Verrucomicrobia bacterium]|nr:hypothetical protein [Verrucomicrobiota bacterium]